MSSYSPCSGLETYGLQALDGLLRAVDVVVILGTAGAQPLSLQMLSSGLE